MISLSIYQEQFNNLFIIQFKIILGVRFQRFIHDQYQKEKEDASILLESIIFEIKNVKKIAKGQNEYPNSSQLLPSSHLLPSQNLIPSTNYIQQAASPYFYYLQYLTKEIKNKVCLEFIAQQKKIFRKEYLKYLELSADFDIKMEQYRQKVKVQEEQRISSFHSTPRSTQNWQNVKKISIAASLFGDLSKKIHDHDSSYDQTAPMVSGRQSSSNLSNQNTPMSNRRQTLVQSPLTNTRQRGFSTFNSAFASLDNNPTSNSQPNSPDQISKQKFPHRASIFQPGLFREESVQQPKMAVKKPRLNLSARKELEDILTFYLNSFKETGSF